MPGQCQRLTSVTVPPDNSHVFLPAGYGKNVTVTVDMCRTELGSGGGTTGAGGSRVSILHTKSLDVNSEGLIVDMTYFDSGES